MLIGLLAGTMPSAVAADSGPIQANTQYGPVVGTATSSNHVFLGVPYAAPPVSNLRWRPPQAPASWTTPRQATTPAPWCMQPTVLNIPHGTTSEDCLYLNVYTPAGATPGSNLPVMLWIHGGGWFEGTGNDYNGSELAKRDNVIVVSFNYRLGPFGYLALPGLKLENPYLSESNYGMQDQQQAMRWVQNNIANFGGNGHNVTLFGESAGSGSICAQLVSPQARGLFQRAIMQSWSCTSPANTMPEATAESRSLQYAADPKLRCTGILPGSVVNCMRSKSAQQLIDAYSPGTPRGVGILGLAKYLVLQTVDGHYLPTSTRAAFYSGLYNHVPVLMGTTENEGNLISLSDYDLIGKPLNNANYTSVIADLLAQFLPIGSRIGAATIAALYPPSNYPAPGYDPAVAPAHLAFGRFLTDFVWSCSQADTNDLSAAQQSRTYAYEFADPSPAFALPSPNFPLDAAHSTDLAYVFGYQLQGIQVSPVYAGMTPQQIALSQQMQDYWANFARSGDPNGPGLPNWPQYRVLTGGQTMKLAPSGESLETSTSYRAAHNCGLWEPVLDIETPLLAVLLALPHN